tara:strand:+ start:1203 stop:1334 length:132 start_codon:yes stop_codon:yes gene_type:complete
MSEDDKLILELIEEIESHIYSAYCQEDHDQELLNKARERIGKE